jgi:hypothetical protein
MDAATGFANSASPNLFRKITAFGQNPKKLGAALGLARHYDRPFSSVQLNDDGI